MLRSSSRFLGSHFKEGPNVVTFYVIQGVLRTNSHPHPHEIGGGGGLVLINTCESKMIYRLTEMSSITID